ncbi:hypothetical protein SCB29_38615, partial [Paraburkholderia sp. SIMBA_055]
MQTLATTTERRISWRRISGPVSALAIAGLAVATTGQALATVVSGRLAEDPTRGGVALLGALI